MDAAADQQPHQHRHQGHRQQRGHQQGPGLGPGQRREHAAFLGLQREHRQEGQGGDQQREEQRRADLLAALGDDLPVLGAARRMPVLAGVAGQLHVGVLDHHDRGIDHRADRDRDAAQRHDVGRQALPAHDRQRHQHPQRQGDHDHQGRARVHQEQRADQGHHRQFGQQLPGKIVDRTVDQLGAVVNLDDLHARGQARAQLVDALLDRIDHRARVLAVAHHHDAADRLALAVELGDADATDWSLADLRDIAQQQRRALGHDAGRHLPQILETADQADAAEQIVGLGQLQARAALLRVRAAQRGQQLLQRESVVLQLERIDHRLEPLHEAADRGHLGHTGHALQFEAQQPVLQAAQLGQVMPAAAVDQRVLVDPADPGGIGAELEARALGQPTLQLGQLLQHPRARPVQVGAVLEQHVGKRITEHRETAHGFGARHRQQLGRERIGQLVLDDLRGLARPAAAHDHLGIGQVRDGVELQALHRDQAGQRQQRGGRQHQSAVGEAGADQGLNGHARAPWPRRGAPSRPAAAGRR
jgi:hypothetical protein